MIVNRKEHESYLFFVKRVTDALLDGLINYQQWGRAIVGEDLYSEESTRRIAKFLVNLFKILKMMKLDKLMIGIKLLK